MRMRINQLVRNTLGMALLIMVCRAGDESRDEPSNVGIALPKKYWKDLDGTRQEERKKRTEATEAIASVPAVLADMIDEMAGGHHVNTKGWRRHHYAEDLVVKDNGLTISSNSKGVIGLAQLREPAGCSPCGIQTWTLRVEPTNDDRCHIDIYVYRGISGGLPQDEQAAYISTRCVTEPEWVNTKGLDTMSYHKVMTNLRDNGGIIKIEMDFGANTVSFFSGDEQYAFAQQTRGNKTTKRERTHKNHKKKNVKLTSKADAARIGVQFHSSGSVTLLDFSERKGPHEYGEVVYYPGARIKGKRRWYPAYFRGSDKKGRNDMRLVEYARGKTTAVKLDDIRKANSFKKRTKQQ